MSETEIERVKEGPAADRVGGAGPVVAGRGRRVALDLVDVGPTWDALSAVYPSEQMLDIVATVGNYHLVAMFLNTTRVALDPGVPDVDIT